jgi:hypothetical protein
LAASGSAAYTSWLIGTTLQAARETGALRRTVATWSDQCVAVAGTDYADADVVGENLRAGRWIVMDLAGASEPTARWLADFAAGLTCELRGAVHRVDRCVFLLSPADTYRAERADAGKPPCADLFKCCHHGSAADGTDTRPAG